MWFHSARRRDWPAAAGRRGLRDRVQKCVKPRKSKVSGFPSPSFEVLEKQLGPLFVVENRPAAEP
jgi:hypothetical protein